MTTYRIGEVAQETGFAPSTLRYYEDQQLLPPPDRSPAGQRLYTDAHVDRLKFVARAKRLGLTLEEIAQLADAWENKPCSITHEQLVDMLEAKLTDIHDEIVELTRFAEQLEAIVRRVAGRPPRPGRCGPDCSCAPALADEVPAQPPSRRFGDLPTIPSSSDG